MKLETSEQLDAVRFDASGLVPVVAQHAFTGEVLMVAYANRESLDRTLETRRMWYYSRSRAQLWDKGATSGNYQRLVELATDCDEDAILARVLPDGPACHTGARSCFDATATLLRLADVIAERARGGGPQSYTSRLLGDENLRLKKRGEEATELALACISRERENVSAEAADLIYITLVAAAACGVSLNDVLAELDRRSGIGRAVLDHKPEQQ